MGIRPPEPDCLTVFRASRDCERLASRVLEFTLEAGELGGFNEGEPGRVPTFTPAVHVNASSHELEPLERIRPFTPPIREGISRARSGGVSLRFPPVVLGYRPGERRASRARRFIRYGGRASALTDGARG